MNVKERLECENGVDRRTSLSVCLIIFFFFKQKTAYEIYQCDWSSDVCSSDLALAGKLRSELKKDVKIAGTTYTPPKWNYVDKELRDRKSVV